jgi:immunity protein 39 of polymorphic toxin system
MKWMATDRKLLASAVSLVRGRVRGDLAALTRVKDELEALLVPEFFENAPFQRVGVIIRYGKRTSLQPEYQRIGTFEGIRELPVAIEVEMDRLRRMEPEEVYAIFRQAVLDLLIAIAEKYGLRSERLREARSMTPTLIEGNASITG